MSVLLRIAYDGTDFHGFARQAPPAGSRRLPTVQGELEAALGRLYKQAVSTRGASRTDAGVHARGQLVAFQPPFEIPMEGLQRGLNTVLPRAIRVVAAWHEHTGRDVRQGNAGKHYRYLIAQGEMVDPLRVRDRWHVRAPLDLAAMRAGAAQLVGTHDFAAFRAVGCQARTTVRTVAAVEVHGAASSTPRGEPRHPSQRDLAMCSQEVRIDVHGQAFLMNMVRIMVGTLVDIGRGRMAPDAVEAAIRSRQRVDAGPTAPALGLTLVEVVWPLP